MSGSRTRPELFTVPASGWCDPETGVCHIDTTENTATAGPDDQKPPGAGATPGDRPEATHE
ncbi:MAG TPA: hypothetical protein VK060_08380 [Ruania sp.]|nr:hypothetical protein [Ruania sp.]